MPRIVVLGTGTEVGKTYFAMALARALAAGRARGPVLALKPVETGLRERIGPKRLSDADRLGRVSMAALGPAAPLFGFRDPVSPHLAARRQGVAISLRKIQAWVRQNEVALRDTALHYWMIVETAGGALSPLNSRETNADLAAALEPAIWILVAPDALGVLHDVRTTLHALRHAAREPDFVVLSAARTPDASTGSNAVELSRLGIAKPIATLPRHRHPRRALARLVSALRERARETRTGPRTTRSR